MVAIRTPQAHINPWLQHAIVRVASYLSLVGGDNILEHYGFLHPYLNTVQQQLPSLTSLVELDKTWQEVVEDWDAALSADFPLVRLRQAGLTQNHLRTLMLVGLVEVDARFGTVYSVLHPFPDESRLTIGLLDDLLRFNGSGGGEAGWRVVQELAQRGLVIVHHPERPRAAQVLSIPSPVWDAICGESLLQVIPSLYYYTQDQLNTLDDLNGLLPSELLKQLTRLPELVDKGLIQGIILRGMRGTGRSRALKAVARSLGYDVLEIQQPDIQTLPQLCRLAGALAVLQRAMPIITLELAPGQTLTLPPLAGYNGIFGIILNREGSLLGSQVNRCLTLQVPAPNYEARRQQWSQILDNGTQALIEPVSQRYHLTLGTIEQVGQLAQAYTVLNGHPSMKMQDVQAACRAFNQQTLDNLATCMGTAQTWDDLIVTDATRAELENLILRCRHRETLLQHLGRGFTGATRGVRSLFGGVSGTGKTLAARIVATELGLDLYRVDLSSVVSKYIGETERNLNQLFMRAEEQDIILLLDEGDSLLTARTDVRNANDRYANLETNYLLQRLEYYEGIILITTNAVNRIDSAFQRRIDVFVEFGLPDVGQRQRLWYLHLPQHHTVSESLIRKVALRCQLTGGQIRNAAFHATMLSVAADTPIDDSLLTAGIQREYTKMGAASPLN